MKRREGAGRTERLRLKGTNNSPENTYTICWNRNNSNKLLLYYSAQFGLLIGFEYDKYSLGPNNFVRCQYRCIRHGHFSFTNAYHNRATKIKEKPIQPNEKLVPFYPIWKWNTLNFKALFFRLRSPIAFLSLPSSNVIYTKCQNI